MEKTTSLYIPDRSLYNIYHFLIYIISNIREVNKYNIRLDIEGSESTGHIRDDTVDNYAIGRIEYIYVNMSETTINYFEKNNNFVHEIFSILFPQSQIINVNSCPENSIILPDTIFVNDYPLPEAYIYLRNRFLPYISQYILNTRKNTPEYIFISRNTDSDRRFILNEDELFEKCEILRKFQKISLTGMSLVDQMALFFNAKVIIAVHGASLTNIIFCNRYVKVIEITSNFLIDKKHFKHISDTFLNIKHNYYFATPVINPNYISSDNMAHNLYIQDCNDFNDFISNDIDCFK